MNYPLACMFRDGAEWDSRWPKQSLVLSAVGRIEPYTIVKRNESEHIVILLYIKWNYN